jgi:hypothetical protein
MGLWFALRQKPVEGYILHLRAAPASGHSKRWVIRFLTHSDKCSETTLAHLGRVSYALFEGVQIWILIGSTITLKRR